MTVAEGKEVYRKGAKAAKGRGGKMGLAAEGRKKTQRGELGSLGRTRGVALPFNVQGVVDSDPPCPWGANGWRESLFIVLSWAGDSEITSPCEKCTSSSSLLFPSTFEVQRSIFDVPLPPRIGGLRSDSCSFACIRGWNSLDVREAIQRF